VKALITVLASGVLMLYPFAIYFGLNYFSPSVLSTLLVGLLLLRLLLVKKTLTKMPWLLPATLLGAIAISYSLVSNSTLGFKLYPIMVNLAMLGVFSYSIYRPPTVIETFARITDKHLTPQAIQYTVKVTFVWCIFFIINGLISFYTAIFSSFEVWMLYNGFVAYVLMGILMGIEYLVRIQVKKKHQKYDNSLAKNSDKHHE